MTLAIISHPECALHEMGHQHPEQPNRIKVIQRAFETYPFSASVTFYSAPIVSRDDLLRVHEAGYLDFINAASPVNGLTMIDEDTLMNPYSLQAALLAAGALTKAVDLVMQGKAQAVFCNVRPPGHHAERNRAMGFCFFNNVAVGVAYALHHYQLERIAIIDFDVHHGNGTQDIFQHDSRVMLCSSFEHPFYPGYNPAKDN